MEHTKVADFYNGIQEKFGDDYETERWFRSPITRGHYAMAHEAITRALKGLSYTDCLELGPGGGTWTKVLLTHAPTARYTLLDISSTMLELARKNLGSAGESLQYVTHDFHTYTPNASYDFFFSSRAIEYMLDKEAVVAKISSLLKDGGEGILITKNPRYWADRLFGRTVPDLHKNQIHPRALSLLLQKYNLSVQRLYPATVTVPLFRSALLNTLMYRLLKYTWIPVISSFFAESYLVHVRKKSH